MGPVGLGRRADRGRCVRAAAALAFAPPWVFEWKSPQRRWSLGVACTAWVFSCWAAWRLSEREPTATPAAAGSRWLLRWCTVAYLAGPFIAELAPQYNAGAGWAFLIFGSLIAGLIATGAWFAYAGHFAQREGWRGMRLEADLLIPLSGFVFLLAFMPGSSDLENSLSRMLGLPLVQFGSIQIFSGVGREIGEGSWPHPLLFFAGVLPLWSSWFVLRLFLRLRRIAAADAGYNRRA